MSHRDLTSARRGRSTLLLSVVHFFVSGMARESPPHAWLCREHGWRWLIVGPLFAIGCGVALVLGLVLAPSRVLNAPLALKLGLGPTIVATMVLVRRAYRGQKRSYIRHLAAAKFEVCLECGYSLQGMPSRGRCPECGERYSITFVVATWRRWADSTS